MANEVFLGRGWSFPPSFVKTNAEVETVFGVTDIEQSLRIIFTTELGERVMNPTFGASLAQMVYEPMNTTTAAYIENLVKTAILYHEPRIDAQTITVQGDELEGTLRILVQYTVRGTNSRFNFVFPFYLNEGRL